MHKALRPISFIVPIALGYYLGGVYIATSRVRQSAVTATDTAPPSFFKSKAYTIVNPRGYTGSSDSRTIVIALPPQKASSSDEQILSDFTNGLFRGRVFGPERCVLQLLRRNLTGFSQNPSFKSSESIWSSQQLFERRLPPLGSIMFGTFQFLDSDLKREVSIDHISASSPSESFVDIGFGSDGSRFSGFHRFSISREQTPIEMNAGTEDVDRAAGGIPTAVRITFSAFACNPSTERPPSSGLFSAFHKLYAMLLFREGVANVLRS